MINGRQIKMEMLGLEELKSLVDVYEEVAAGRMQKIRGAVLQSRSFMDGLIEVFSKVIGAYKRLPEKERLIRRLNKQTVAVFVAANARLYGDIVERTFENFSTYVTANKPEVVVLGKTGMQMMADKRPDVLFNYFDFSDVEVEMESFNMIMRYLLQFESIVVFHGRFKTLLNQEAAQTMVSGEALMALEEGKAATDGAKDRYLFEPSIQEVAKVFEGEILASIFEQTLHESHLSKFASRLLALDRSVENIERRIKQVKGDQIKWAHKKRNSKQLQTIAGVNLWT